jgi:UDP-3-O-[3-hydroxymyristoyl] glucosamine N-acyltransferase
MSNMTLEQLIEIIGESEIIGSTDTSIIGLNRIEHATANEITFLEDIRYEKYLESSHAGFVLVKSGTNFLPKENQVFIRVSNPYLSFLKLVHIFAPDLTSISGIHPTAVVESTAQISPSATIGANCYIGENSIIKDRAVIYPNSSIQRDVTIGENCIIYSNVSIYYGCTIGRDCIIHSGAVIGSDGFGFQENKDGSYTKIPQIGKVIIGDSVEIGANTTIDRAFVGSTIIEYGVKLDNLIQIAHNDEIGENSAMAAQVGISGSTKIGKRVRLGGQVGISGHIEIGDDVVLLAKSGVPKSMTEKGIYIGAPARDRLTAFKIEAVIHNLPQLSKDVDKIKKKLGIE